MTTMPKNIHNTTSNRSHHQSSRSSYYCLFITSCAIVATVQLVLHWTLVPTSSSSSSSSSYSLAYTNDNTHGSLQSFKQGNSNKLSINSNNNVNNNNDQNVKLDCTTTTTTNNNEQDDVSCCSTWDINVDNWWIHHPDWYISSENDDGFCFSRIIHDAARANFLRHVYNLQWNHHENNNNNNNNNNNSASKNCNNVLTAYQSNSGYSASVNQIIYGFWSAYQQGVPFQITKHRPQMEWMFASKDETNWVYCPSKDMNCYYLPLSDCTAEIGAEQKYQAIKPTSKEDKQMFQWLRLFATRPQQHVRKKVYDFITKVQGLPPLPWDKENNNNNNNNNFNCTVMHVRRGDSGFVKFPWRRYAAVQEYIDKANIQKGDTIVLLTDDVSTIEEVEKYHANDYTWIYLKRQRTRGTEGGFNKHIPSGDPALEVITIMAEVKIASQCNKLVAGDSGFVTTITDAMDAVGKQYTRYNVQTRVKEADVKKDRNIDAKIRVEKMLNDIDSSMQNEKT